MMQDAWHWQEQNPSDYLKLINTGLGKTHLIFIERIDMLSRVSLITGLFVF